jgi:hypothetical protein
VSAKSALVEVASVIAIIGSVAAISVPKAAEVQSGRTADRVAEDVETVRGAVLAFHSDSAYFPPEATGGDIPVSLESYLPARFSFRRSYGTLEYKNWPQGTFVPPTTALADSVVADSNATSGSGADSLAVAGVPLDTGLAALSPRIAARGSRVPTAALASPAPTAENAAADSIVPGRIIGVSVTTRDAQVGLIAAQRARRMARFIVGDKVTFILFGA